MRQRRLGRTNLQVSEIGFGAWAIGGNKHGHSYGPTDNAESLRSMAQALDLGCTFFDTADLYGHLFKETSVSAMAKLSMRISGAVKGGNVVEIGTGTNG